MCLVVVQGASVAGRPGDPAQADQAQPGRQGRGMERTGTNFGLSFKSI